jgi:hypothetical protein
MAAGTTLVAVRVAFRTLLQARPDLDGVQVTYGRPRTDLPPEAIWFEGRSEADHVRLAATGGVVKTVEENYDFNVVLQVLAEADAEDLGQAADERAVELFAELQQTVAAAPTVIDAVKVAQISGWTHDSAALGSSEQGSRFVVTVRVTAHLTAA